MKLFTLIALLSALSAPAWAANKCTAADGKVLFQDGPCPGIGITVEQDLRERAAAKLAAQEAAKTRSEEVVDDYAARTVKAKTDCGGSLPEYPTIGMAESMFLRCTQLGLFPGAYTVNETVTANGSHKQYVFDQRLGLRIRYLYVRNHVVTAIQR